MQMRGLIFWVAHLWFALHFTSGAAMAENLINTGKWSFFADTVMGGVSEGDAGYVNSDIGKALRLNGSLPQTAWTQRHGRWSLAQAKNGI